METIEVASVGAASMEASCLVLGSDRSPEVPLRRVASFTVERASMTNQVRRDSRRGNVKSLRSSPDTKMPAQLKLQPACPLHQAVREFLFEVHALEFLY